MSRVYLLFCFVLPCLIIASGNQLNEFSYCKKHISSIHLEVELDCRKLDFQFIPPQIFDLTAKRIYLSENPYYCDCGIVWFIHALEKKSIKINIVDFARMRCAVPKKMKGKMIKGLTKNDVCPDERPCQHLKCSRYSDCIADHLPANDRCVCKPAFKGNGTFCEDLDECSLDTHNCAHYEDCYNTLGGFNCRCKSGLIVDSKGQCDVPQPCEALFKPCDSTSEVCVNKQRGFDCLCKEGFHKESGATTCTEVNECTRRNICPKHARCINKIGSYQCICMDGYTDDKKACDDIDECESGEHRCPKNSVCINKDGGYKCACNPGYKKAKNETATFCAVIKEEDNLFENEIIFYGGAGVAVLIIFTICCCCCCYRRRKSKKQRKGSKAQLTGDQAMKANEDLLNMAMETDPFLLQQQQVEQQMYMLGMQQQQQQYMPYFDDGTTAMPPKGVRLNDSTITTWSYDDDEDEYTEGYYDEVYN